MARFVLPSLPLPIRIWRYSNWGGTIPPANVPDVSAMANLIPGRREIEQVTSGSAFILVDKLTDIRFSESGVFSFLPASDPDLVEVPSGSGRFYMVADVEKVGGGFANEHQEAQIIKQSPWGGGVAPSTWTIIQSLTQVFESVPGATVFNMAWPSDEGGNNLLVCAVAVPFGVTVTVSDSASGPFNQRAVASIGTLSLYLFDLLGSVGGISAVVTITLGAASPVTAAIAEISRGPGVPIFDMVATNTGHSKFPTVGPSAPTANDCQVVVGSFPPSLPNNWGTPPSPFTLIDTIDAIGVNHPAMQWAASLNDATAETPTLTGVLVLDYAAIISCYF